MALAGYIKQTAPTAQKREPVIHTPRVETLVLAPGDHRVSIDAMGSVVPARELTLKARVSGQVKSLHPEFSAGGIVEQGERLVQIDPQDFRLALARQESQLADARYKLKLEMGYQEVARREWNLINQGAPSSDEDEELALRRPHLAKARSDLAAAEAELEQARLNLARTEITAPFNAVVRITHVEVGSQVSTQDALAELVGTDEYWIRVSLPVDRLRWIHIPVSRSETGASAIVHYRGTRRTGRVIRLLSDLETQGRMARILVSVEDPLGHADPTPDRPPLLIGEYVRVEIQGQALRDVYRIPRTALRDGDTIWVAGGGDTLQIKPVDIVWRDDRFVLIADSLDPGDRLIVSDLATPVAGMRVDPAAGIPAESPAVSGTSGGEGQDG
jgi:RND family efflux transporter MFP subunit